MNEVASHSTASGPTTHLLRLNGSVNRALLGLFRLRELREADA